MKEYTIKGIVAKDEDGYYINDGTRKYAANDLLLGIDSICMSQGGYMISEGEEIEIVLKVKGR